jgi:hypothetical protein
MARNPFEQLQDTTVEPRQAFEDIVSLILKCLYPDSRRVRVYRGDGGIDAFIGTLGDGGEATVYQVKYFPAPWGDSQKRQIREAYQTARASNDYELERWILCVPVRLAKEDLRWFDEWRKKQDRPIELLDGDDLTEHIADERCAKVRTKLREWNVIGLQGGGPQLNATAFIRRENYQKTGLTAVVVLRIENEGDRSARGIKATISHAETGCLAHNEYEDWERSPNDGSINPRMLRYRHLLNPGDHSVIMGIPLCETSTLPFTISMKLTAEDCRPFALHCELNSEQVAIGEPVTFGGMPPTPLTSSASSSSEPKLVQPRSPAAKEILELMLAHPVHDERGLTEILGSSPASPLEACFIPNTTARGGAPSVKKSLLRVAIAELVQLGWLLPPEGDGKVRIYELDQRENVT